VRLSADHSFLRERSSRSQQIMSPIARHETTDRSTCTNGSSAIPSPDHLTVDRVFAKGRCQTSGLLDVAATSASAVTAYARGFTVDLCR